MLVLIGYTLAVVIGCALGMVGGGGSILVIPVLVFFFKIDPSLATTYSLFIVGLSALCGSSTQWKEGNISFRAVAQFGIPSVIVLFVVRRWLLPAVPAVLFHSGGVAVSKSLLVMLVFTSLMLTVGYTMIRQKKYAPGESVKRPRLFVQGALTGAVTGFIGIGGGFIIVPSLVLFAGLPMRKAIGTSLVIISINCAVGILSNFSTTASLNYPFLLRFAVLTVIGILLGSWAIKHIPDNNLKPVFGWIILGMGFFMVVRLITGF